MVVEQMIPEGLAERLTTAITACVLIFMPCHNLFRRYIAVHAKVRHQGQYQTSLVKI